MLERIAARRAMTVGHIRGGRYQFELDESGLETIVVTDIGRFAPFVFFCP
jgi:hypothetical protein